MAPEHIVRDLTQKVGDDTAAAINRSVSLLVTPQDHWAVALGAAGAAVGSASGFAQVIYPDLSPEQQVDLIWTIMRPLALAAAGGDRADLRALLRQCRGSGDPEKDVARMDEALDGAARS